MSAAPIVPAADVDTLCTQLALGHAGSSLVPPIPWSATFVAEDAADFARMAGEPMHPAYYTRYGNPLHAQLAAQIARLEAHAAPGGEAAHAGLVTASGMAAISTVLLSSLQAGDHVVGQTQHYMGTAKLLDELLPRFGVRCTLVPPGDTTALQEAIRPDTRLVMVETPVNPDCSVVDLRAVAARCREVGALSVCDNTFATPINQRPLEHGIDVVVHSATKYLSGHHDATAGAIVARRERIELLWKTLICLGPVLSPMDAFLVLRGLRTLALRVRRHNELALALASWLEAHPKVERVLYPGLASHPQHALARSQMQGGGGVMNLRIRGDRSATERFVRALRLPAQAVSLGGVESLVVHAAAMWGGSLTDAQLRTAGVAPNAVRFSVGLEGEADLRADLDQALQQV